MRFPLRLSYALGPLFKMVGIRQENSYVQLDGKLRVCMGAWFDETFDLSSLQSVQRSSVPWYAGLGVKLGPGPATVSVVGAREGVVSIRFKAPQRVHVLLALDCMELRVAVEDPDAVLAALSQHARPG